MQSIHDLILEEKDHESMEYFTRPVTALDAEAITPGAPVQLLPHAAGII